MLISLITWSISTGLRLWNIRHFWKLWLHSEPRFLENRPLPLFYCLRRRLLSRPLRASSTLGRGAGLLSLSNVGPPPSGLNCHVEVVPPLLSTSFPNAISTSSYIRAGLLIAHCFQLAASILTHDAGEDLLIDEHLQVTLCYGSQDGHPQQWVKICDNSTVWNLVLSELSYWQVGAESLSCDSFTTNWGRIMIGPLNFNNLRIR